MKYIKWTVLIGGNRMAKARKDLRGHALKKGEIQRKDDQRYMYTYTDPLLCLRHINPNHQADLFETFAPFSGVLSDHWHI